MCQEPSGSTLGDTMGSTSVSCPECSLMSRNSETPPPRPPESILWPPHKRAVDAPKCVTGASKKKVCSNLSKHPFSLLPKAFSGLGPLSGALLTASWETFFLVPDSHIIPSPLPLPVQFLCCAFIELLVFLQMFRKFHPLLSIFTTSLPIRKASSIQLGHLDPAVCKPVL